MSKPLDLRLDPSAVPIRLLRGASPPMTEQLVIQIRALIEHGGLAAAARLPSSRALARELAVSRTVVTEGYEMLVAEGYLETRRGSGTYVVERRPAAPRAEPPLAEKDPEPRWLRRRIDPADIDPPVEPGVPASFRICEPALGSFPDQAWRTCARAAINEPLPDGYGPPEGDRELRQAIAALVARERGLRCAADEVLVTSGTTQSLDLIARATLVAGDAVAFEDPGYRLARQIFTDRGARIQPIEVDEQGLVVRQLATRPAPHLVYTTPSHQFPLGSVLSYCRRNELLEWAASHGALVIEDDYDSEFRFGGPALPALAANDRSGSVAYLGTFSKALAPSLRLGYMVAPRRLRQAVLDLKVRSDYHSCWLSQRALARYLTSGAFGRHLRRMRRLYRQRRDCLVAALAPLPPAARWVGLAAGLHATLRLPPRISPARVAAACRRRGVFVTTLRDYAVGPDTADGLVLGYGACPPPELEAMAAVVRGAWQQPA